MKGFLKYLPILLVLAFPLPASAQRNSIDEAIALYESICNECIILREKAQSGEPVQSGSFAELLSKLSGLRSLLSNSKDQMTRSQKMRLESIRLRYEEAFPSAKSKQNSGAKLFALQPAPLVVIPAVPLTGPGLATPTTPGLPHSSSVHAHLTSSASTLSPSSQMVASSTGRIPLVSAKRKALGVIAVGELPLNQAGLMVAFSSGRIGGYLKGTASPSFQSASYDCFSNGTTENGSIIWTTGKERNTGYSLTAGITVSVANPFSIYLGGGYGRSGVLWKDSSSDWARVADMDLKGVKAETGLIFSIGRFSILAGASTLSLKDYSFQAGLGFNF